MAKTTAKKPKNPMMSLQAMLQGDRPQGGLSMGPPAPPTMNKALLGGSFAAPPPPSMMGFLGQPPPAPLNLPGQTPSLQAMRGMGMGVSPEMESGMTNARRQGLQRERDQQGLMGPPVPTAGPPAPAPGVARVAPGMSPYQPPGMAPAGALTPNAKAIIDAMTGKRVHKGLGGQQLGMEGVDPALKYMLYAQRGRRHIGFGGKEIY